MFPDSQIAQKCACGQTKCSYLIRFGLAPYFEKEVLDMVTKPERLCVVSFDESFNKIIQQEQMDLILRFWDEEINFNLVSMLDQAGIVQISMDGTATNWSFFDKLLHE